MDNKSLNFLDDKNKITLKAMLDMRKSKVISYHDLARMSQVFGVDLFLVEKKSINRIEGETCSINYPTERRWMHVKLQEKQTNLDDFMNNNDFFGNFNLEKVRKNKFFSN